MKPYFTLSKSVILDQHDKVKELADIVAYSSKTNPLVTPILEETRDCLFNIHLPAELKHVQDKSRVLFLAQGLIQEELEELWEVGVRKIAVDNIADLDFLLSFLEDKEDKIELLLRMKLKANTLKTERYFVFGIDPHIINQKIRELWGHKNIAKLGIHFHRKSQNMAEWNYEYELTQQIDQDVWEIIDYLDIGGGLPSVYANTNETVIDSIFAKLRSLRQFLKERDVQLIMEPGRFIAAPAGELHAHIKLVYENNIIVDVSVYNTDMDALVVPVKLLVKNELSKDEGEPYVVKGKTPCNMDLFRYKVYLKNPQVGEKLIFINAGAYNFTTDFCDLEKLETKVIA